MRLFEPPSDMGQLTTYAQTMMDDAEAFFAWRWYTYGYITLEPRMLAEYRAKFGQWNPHCHRPHAQRTGETR